MAVVWLFLAFFMFATNRWYQHFWKYAQIMHTLIGVIMVVMSSISFYMALKHLDWTFETGHHNVLGVAIDFGVILVSMGGFVAIYAQTRLNWSTEKIRWFRNGHKFAARII